MQLPWDRAISPSGQLCLPKVRLDHVLRIQVNPYDMDDSGLDISNSKYVADAVST